MNLSLKIRIVQCDFDSSFTQSGKQKTLTNFYPRPPCVIRIEGIDSYSRKGEIILARTREYLKLSLQDSV